MTENKRYVRILDYSEKEVRIFDEHNQKNIFNIFFMGLDSAICLKGALEDTVDLLNYFYEENKELKFELKECRNNKLFSRRQLEKENEQLKSKNKILLEHCDDLQERNDRQAKQLDNIYNLIEKQDWKQLQGIIQEFQECEEQLQMEFRCYD